MVKITLVIIVSIVLASKFYDWIVYKENPPIKDKIYMFLFLVAIILFLAEEIFSITF